MSQKPAASSAASATDASADDGHRAQSVADKAEAVRRKSVFIGVFFTLLLDLLGFTLILPLLPSILDHYAALGNDRLFNRLVTLSRSARLTLLGVTGANETSAAASPASSAGNWDSVLLGGLLGSGFSILQFASAPLAGGLSDVYGRRPVLAASLLGTAAAYALWSRSAASFAAFLASRVIAGLARCSVTVCTAAVSDVSAGDHRGRGMMWIGLAFSAAFLIGPAVGAGLAQSMRADPAGNFGYPAALALGLACCALVWARWRLEETLPVGAMGRPPKLSEGLRDAAGLMNPTRLFAFASLRASDRDRQQMRRIAAVYFMFMIVFSGLEFTLPFLAHLRLGFSRAQQGYMFLCIGLSSAALQGCLVRRLRAGSERRLATVAMVALAPAGLLLGVAGSTSVFYAGVLLFSLSSACPVPALTALLSQLAPPESQGRALGVLRSLGSLARAIGPLVSSLAFWLYGPALSYGIGGLAAVLPVAQLVLLVQPYRPKSA